MRLTLPRALSLCLLMLAVGIGTAHARRLALVIGNDNYAQVSRLDKAGNDAESMAKELEGAGFEVSLKRDLGYRKMVVAFEEFYDKVKGGDEVVVFYAGHGVQTERGAYLLPTDVEGETQSQIEKISYSVNNLLEELDRVKARFSLIVVDACRDNPLRSRGRTIGIARGLSAPDIAKGQMVIFSAGRNQKALDSLNAEDKHPNGVFTREFLSRMRTPGLSVENLAIEVKNAVEKLAMTVKHEQRPLIVNDSTGDFFFFPAARTAAAAPASPGADAVREDRFWDDAKSADNIEAYEAYLVAYPVGRYRGLARAHISRLSGRSTTALATPPTARVDPAPGTPGSSPPGAAPLPSPTPPAGVPGPSGQPPSPVASVPSAAPGSSGTAAPVGSALPSAATPPAPAAAPGGAAVAPGPGASAPLGDAALGAAAALIRTQAKYALPNGDRYEGEVIGATRSGRGTYHFANGDRYEGEFVDNQFMGQGAMHFANGDVYEGQFRGTTKQGRGKMVFANKDRYEGDFVDNLYEGKGTFNFASGESYTGDYKRGLKHGKGVHVFANKDRYEGAFENDKAHGRGTTLFANGDRFEGEFVQGIKQGAGVYHFANGDRYEGNFENNVFSGRGRLYLANGDRYEGTFSNNLKEGSGTHYFANKDRYEGEFRGGMQNGRGTHFFANGDRYEGEFAAGVRHGKGVHRFAGGQAREMEYVNGAEKAQ